MAILFALTTVAQQQVTSMVTSSGTLPAITYSNVKGAGQRNAVNVLSSLWDSTGTSFTVNFNAVPNNITSLQQFSVSGFAQPFIKQPVNALVKIRRTANAFVTDTRDHYNFWSFYSAIPATNATSGTFDILGPEVTSPEAAFLSNNLNSGYDNIFQNSLNSLHAGNIERIDFIVPEGVRPARLYDINNAGVLVLDRGTGDPFKIAVITSVDANNDPLTYGPMVTIAAANYGPNLMPGSLNYCIFIHDPNIGSVSRPSSSQTQNMRGVFMTFANLSVAVNQRIYGYSLFGQDVATPNINWNTYPNNSNFAAQLDPVNVLAFFRDVSAVLPVPVSFELAKQNNHPEIAFSVYNESSDDVVIIERSFNGRDFEEIKSINVPLAGQYGYTDKQSLSGLIYYRLKTKDVNGNRNYSAIKNIRLNGDGSIHLSPNPAKERLTFSVPDSWQQHQVSAVIFDASGVRILQQSFTANGMQTIELKELKPGGYFISLTNEKTKQTEVRKVLIAW